MGYPKCIEAYGGVMVTVSSEAEEEAFLNPPNKPVEPESAPVAEAEAPEEASEGDTHIEDAPAKHAPVKKGAKKK
jgi:hypothetical protein